MSHFASTKLREIDMGNDEVVRIPAALSYALVLELTSIQDQTELSKMMLVKCIKEWTIKDELGIVPEVTEENILKLDVNAITLISNEIAKLMTNDQNKKK